MAFQLPQRDFGGASNKGSVTGAHVPQQETSTMGSLMNVLNKVSSKYVQDNTNKEIAKKVMEGQQAIQQGASLDDIKSGESWVNTIFGDSATLEGARQAQAEASFLNGYSDLIGQMDELKKLPPEEYNKTITDHYSKYLTGDVQVDNSILANTSKIRTGLMKTHAGEHTAWVQEENIKGVTALTRAKVEASVNSIASVSAFTKDPDQIALQEKQEVDELSEYLRGVASKGNSEQSVIAQKVVMDLQEGSDLAYQATDGYAFTNKELSAIQSAKRVMDKSRTEKLTAKQAQAKGLAKSVILDNLSKPDADLNQSISDVNNYIATFGVKGDGITSMYKQVGDAVIQQTQFTNALQSYNQGGSFNVSPDKVEDFHEFTLSRIKSTSTDAEQAQQATIAFRNAAPISSKYTKKVSRGLGILVKDDKASPEAIASFNEIHQYMLAAKGEKKYSLNQIDTQENKNTFLQILETMDSTNGDVEAAIIATSMDKEAAKIATTPPSHLALLYKQDPKQYDEDVNIASDLCSSDDTLCAQEATLELRDEMGKVARLNRGGDLDVDRVREIAAGNLALKRYEGVSGLSQTDMSTPFVENGKSVENQLQHTNGGWFKSYTPKDQLMHYFKSNTAIDTPDSIRSKYNKQTGNFIVTKLNEDGTIAGLTTVAMKDVAQAWRTSPAVRKHDLDKLNNAVELEKAQGTYDGPKSISWNEGVAAALGDKRKKQPISSYIPEEVKSVLDFAVEHSTINLLLKATQQLEDFSPFASGESLGVVKETEGEDTND